MKSFLLIGLSLLTLAACGQEDKSKRPSPPATAKETLTNGKTVTIDYSQPALNGRTIGDKVEPMPGKVWRTGANEATVFTVDKDVKVEGKPLAAGKYGLFTILDGTTWTIIFNKTWDQWGAFDYKEADDVLRVKVEGSKAPSSSERMTFTISKDGKVALLWGDHVANFKVE